jgi:branched-chain amino acid transport system substrate-binding protein
MAGGSNKSGQRALVKRRQFVGSVGGNAAGVAVPALLRPGSARADSEPLRLGVLTDLNSWARDVAGPGSVQAVKMAVVEFGTTVIGRPIEILVGDHQMKPDVGSEIARDWFGDQNVHSIIDVPNSSIGIAVHNLARDKNRIALLSRTFVSETTGRLSSLNTAQFALETYALGGVTASALMADGARSFFFVTADFAFGHSRQAETSAAVLAGGGRIIGSVVHPPGTTEFASYLLQAQSSGADVIAFANSAADTVNSIKQAAEFGVMASRQKVAALLLFETDIHAIGLQTTQGVYAALATCWDLDDRTRALSHRFFEVVKAMPTMTQTGSYSGALHYLRSVSVAGTDQPKAVIQKMRELPIDDAFLRGAWLRADGRVIEDAFLAQVKKQAESSGSWDLLRIHCRCRERMRSGR